MVKLAHHPTREEMKRLRARWDAEDGDDIPLKPFDTTLTPALDDTIQHLRIVRESTGRSVEADNLRSEAIKQLADEVRQARAEIGKIVETLNRKASKGQLAHGLTEIAARLDKRVDNIFKLVAALGVILGVLIAIKR